MNNKQAERAVGVRDEMNARATEQARHVAYMEAARIQDAEFIAKQNKRIEKLERRTMLLGAATDHDAVAIGKLREHIEKLEVALLDVARCLIDGKVDVDIDAANPGTMFHRYRILGSEMMMTLGFE